jgi:phosphatidylserine decarboxylase
MNKIIEVIDRVGGERFEEKVAGRAGLEFLLFTLPGKAALETIVKKRWFSALYGLYQDSRLSRRDIEPFVQMLDIDMSEAQRDISAYESFNDFFVRKLRPEARPIEDSANRLVLPADGRITVIPEIRQGQVLSVKGVCFSLAQFLGSESLAKRYEEGAVVIIRLCPADYHRYHFPLGGIPGPSMRIPGNLYSVNPLAIRARPGLFMENERQICIHRCDELGEILVIEVGATMVGKIVQTYEPQRPVQKGDEKGYFCFGASTTVLVLPPSAVKLDEDLIFNSEKGFETLDKMGRGFATIL